MWGRVVAGLMLAMAASPVCANAWTQSKGKGQVIVKAEAMRAVQGYDPSGSVLPLVTAREDRAGSIFAQYGLTDALTVQFKGDWQSGKDAFVDYQGRGPLEVGLIWQAYRDDHNAVSLYAAYATAGDGRNAGYSAPGVGDDDWEIRAAVGRSFGQAGGRRAGSLIPDQSFAEVQLARRLRGGLADETRLDVTLGAHINDDWMVLGQAFGGMTDSDGARWLSVETSIVRNLGRWSLQAGWRQTVAGRETPKAQGVVLAIWRRF